MIAGRNDWIKPTTLAGRNVRLVPLSQEHRDGLVEAVRDGALWRLWYTSAPAPEEMEAEIDRRLGPAQCCHLLLCMSQVVALSE